MTIKFIFKLGVEVKDKVTGYKGIVIGRTEWQTGCNTYGVKSQTLNNGAPADSQWMDEMSLEKISDGINVKKDVRKGGPQITPKRNTVGE